MHRRADLRLIATRVCRRVRHRVGASVRIVAGPLSAQQEALVERTKVCLLDISVRVPFAASVHRLIAGD